MNISALAQRAVKPAVGLSVAAGVGLAATTALGAKPAHAADARKSVADASPKDGVADGALYGALIGAFGFGVGAIPGALVGVVFDSLNNDSDPESLDKHWVL